MRTLVRDVQFNAQTGTYTTPKGYDHTLASLKKRLNTVRGIEEKKQEELKNYDILAVVYQDNYGKPQVMWLLEQNGVGVNNPALKKYLEKTGKYLDGREYSIITNEDLNEKINQSWKKGIYYMDGSKYSGVVGGTLRASAYVQSVKGTLDESGLTDAVMGLGLSVAAMRGSVTFEKGSVTGKRLDINIKKFEIKDKHLNSSTAKRARKFNVSSTEEANKIVQDALKNGKLIETIPNGIGSQGQNSFSSIIDTGKVIGTKGETHIKIVYDELKNVWTTYPVPKS